MWIFSVESLLNNSIFLYALLLILIFAVFIAISSVAMRSCLRKNSYVNYKELLVSPHAPAISVIAPVFNLEHEVVNHVRALHSLQYNNFDLIVVNDGSTDGTLEKLKDFYQLEQVDFAVHEQIKTQQVRALYKSKNPAYAKLTVIDKEAGGRSDALNAGLNTSERDLVLCIEVNCFLDQFALLKLVKPFLESEKRVIVAGAAVHIANSSTRKNGHLVDIKYPGKLLPAFQTIEYFKSFLVERLAWNRLNGIHIISGVISLFDKEILIQSGGYDPKLYKGGFELVIRMSRYMHDNGLKYKVAYLPDSLCWIQAPESLRTLAKQRTAWAKGNLQAFRLHRNLFFNKQYGALGMINFPYWFLSEWVNPAIKLLFLASITPVLIFAHVDWVYTGILLLLLYFLAVLLSAFSVLLEETSSRPNPSFKDILRMLGLIFIEPVIYHPLTVFWKLKALFSVKLPKE